VGGGTLRERVVVAPAGIRLAGRPPAEKPGAPGLPTLVAWQVDGEPRVATWAQGLLPNGDIGPGGTATLEVFDCGRGTFRLFAIGRDDSKLTLARDGTTVATYDIWPRGAWEQRIATDAGGGRCTFALSSTSLVHLDEFSWTPARPR
jgi:hypothetical protein